MKRYEKFVEMSSLTHISDKWF